MTVLVYEWIVSIALNFTSSLLLIHIFLQIYKAVKATAEIDQPDSSQEHYTQSENYSNSNQ